MDELIKLLTDGFIRHIIQLNRFSYCLKREDKENFDWIVSKNERDIDSNHVSDNSQLKRKKL